jgi:sugar/nucleoside kinase (ribokinase family)
MDECGVALIRHAKSEKANTKSSHEIIFCPPPTIDPCEIVSTSGSGDWFALRQSLNKLVLFIFSFNSGFLAAHIFDKDIFECLRFGSLCAIESLKGPDPVPESLCSLTVRS